MTWEKKQLKELCAEIIDCVNKTAPESETVTPYKMLRTTNIRNGVIDEDNVKYVTQKTFDIWTRRGKLKVGDIVFTREAPLGEVGIVRQAENFFLGQRLVLFRADPKVCDNKFLLYALQFRDNKEAIIAKGVGATVLHLRVPECEKIEINVPPIQTQKRIGALLSAYDDLIENNKKQIKLLEEAAQRLYKEWFVDLRFPGHENVPVVDGVPEGWEKCTITDLLNIGYGKDHKKLSDGDIPAYGSGGIFRKVNQKLHSGEAVLIPRKGTLNNIIHVDSDFWTIDTMFFGVPKIENCAKYAYFYLRYQDMYSYNIGAAVPSMTVNILDGMELLLPTKLMLENFERTIEPLFSKQKLLTKQNETLTLSRDFLLPKLMSGEIEV